MVGGAVQSESGGREVLYIFLVGSGGRKRGKEEREKGRREEEEVRRKKRGGRREGEWKIRYCKSK